MNVRALDNIASADSNLRILLINLQGQKCLSETDEPPWKDECSLSKEVL